MKSGILGQKKSPENPSFVLVVTVIGTVFELNKQAAKGINKCPKAEVACRVYAIPGEACGYPCEGAF